MSKYMSLYIDTNKSLIENVSRVKQILRESIENPSYMRTIPSLLMNQELRFLQLLARDYYSAKGYIVDTGICLGGSTEAFLRGIVENKIEIPYQQPICAYELGYAASYIAEFIDANCNEKISTGDDFIHITRKNISLMESGGSIRLYEGDIRVAEYPENIEILFIDVAQTPEENIVTQKMFSRLLPGRSIVIQHNFLWGYLPWLQCTMGYLSDYFEYIGNTTMPSAVWLLKKEIPESVLKIDVYSEAGLAVLDKCFLKSEENFSPWQRRLLEIDRAWMHVHKGDASGAHEILERVAIEIFPKENYEMHEEISKQLVERVYSYFTEMRQKLIEYTDGEVEIGSIFPKVNEICSFDVRKRFIQLDTDGENELKNFMLMTRFNNEEYMNTEAGKNDFIDHFSRRQDNFRSKAIPWLENIHPLKDARVLEIGCGTGSFTVALCEQGAIVNAIDVDMQGIEIAKKRLSVYGLSADVEALSAVEIKTRFQGGFDFIIYSASMEHMTYNERIQTIQAAYDMLRENQYMIILETPNRLWHTDFHTSREPFFNWLPDTLAADYAKFTNREFFSNLGFDKNSEESMLTFARYGRGVSYHEFEIAVGVGNLELISNMNKFLNEPTNSFEMILKEQGPSRIDDGFYKPELNIALIKKTEKGELQK